MTATPQPADWGDGFTLIYDAWNRLVQVKDGDTTVATYAYDGQNWRVIKTAGGVTRHYYYTSSWQVAEERTGTSTIPDRQFVWGVLGLDNLVLRDRPSSSERLYPLPDYANVTTIVNSSGTVLERYEYNAFGAPLFMNASFGSISASAYDWETLFCSYRRDTETEFYQVRNRYLHAQLGRWLSRDPVGYDAGVNLYAYCGNNSVNRNDPMGLDDCVGDSPSDYDPLGDAATILGAAILLSMIDAYFGDSSTGTGQGALTLSGNNTYTGGVTINSGTMASAFGASGPSDEAGGGSEGGALDKGALVVGGAGTVAGAVENIQNGSMGIWVGKNGAVNPTSWGGNGATGGRLSFAGEIAENAHAAGTLIGVVGLGVSAVQGYNAFNNNNTNGMVQAGADFGVGVYGIMGGPIGWAASTGYFGGQMIDHAFGITDTIADIVTTPVQYEPQDFLGRGADGVW